MYVTRPLSRYLADPKATAEAPPEGPASGFLVVVDAAAEQASTHCWGLCLDRRVRCLPLPQNRQLCLSQGSSSGPLEGLGTCVDFVSEILSKALPNFPAGGRPPGAGRYVAPPDYAMFVPVRGQPLSSGRYYVVKVDGKHTGKVSACSKPEDATQCCFCSFRSDVKPRAFDHGDVYQQMQVQQHRRRGFKAAAVATDGVPPDYLRNKGWTAVAMARPKYDGLADDARGVDSALRDRMPADVGSLAGVVVGTWYVPFLFVKADGERRLKDQVRKTMFYKMTMEQAWEQIYSRENTHLHGNSSTNNKAADDEIEVTATVHRFTALLGGTTAAQAGWPKTDGGVMWFRPAAAVAGTTAGGVGLDTVLWERMKWELEQGGRWVAPHGGNSNGDEEERIQRVERRDASLVRWSKFGCYVLVERFVLRRMDGTVALTCEFRHTDKIRAKWL